MCNLSTGVLNKGIEQGIKKGREEERLNSIRNLMKTMGIDMKQAMDALLIPAADRASYTEALSQK